MNENCLNILKKFLTVRSGRINKQDLYELFPQGQRYISALNTGNRPNIYLDHETSEFCLTQKGVETLRAHDINVTDINVTLRVDLNNLPDFIRPKKTRTATRTATDTSNGTVQNMLELTIERNNHLTFKVVVHDILKNWIKTQGRLKNLSNDYGASVCKNWDGNEETKYYAVDLGDVDYNFQGQTNIISNYGINSLIIKLACATDNNEYIVKYKGLVSWEDIQNHGRKLVNDLNRFYKNFIKPVNFKVALQFVE